MFALLAARTVIDLTRDVTGQLPLANIANQANATFLSNVSGGSAAPSANTLPTTANALIKTNNTNGALVASLVTDDGTTHTYTGTGGSKSPLFTATGTVAGFGFFPQGTDPTATAGCNTATSICEYAPTAVTAYFLQKPAAAPTIASIKQTDTCASAKCVETFHIAPLVLSVTSNFTTAANTNLQTITGLSYTGPGSLAYKADITCDIYFHQNTAAVADAFGVQDVTTAPNEIDGTGFVQTAATTWSDTIMTALTTTTASNITTMTPSAITTNWHARLHLLVDQPSGTASAVNIMIKTGTAADTLTVMRGSDCTVTFQ